MAFSTIEKRPPSFREWLEGERDRCYNKVEYWSSPSPDFERVKYWSGAADQCTLILKKLEEYDVRPKKG